MTARKAVYAGSFDPITRGHLWMIERGAELFDELIVAIGVNPDKRYTFTVEERQRMLAETVKNVAKVRVDTFENDYLVNYAASVGASFILRGIRTEADYQFERTMRYINSDFRPEMTTVFLVPPREISEVSSSMVKGLIGPRGWEDIVLQYVPEPVYEMLLQKFSRD